MRRMWILLLTSYFPSGLSRRHGGHGVFQKGSEKPERLSGRFRGPGLFRKQACEAAAGRETRPLRRTSGSVWTPAAPASLRESLLSASVSIGAIGGQKFRISAGRYAKVAAVAVCL